MEEELRDATDRATVEAFEQALRRTSSTGPGALLAQESGMTETVEMPRVAGPGEGLGGTGA